MAKLTPKKRENIIALWKTGGYSKSELARRYKVTETTIRKVVKQTPQTTAETVRAGVKFEMMKGREKVVDKKAIDSAVNEQSKREIDNSNTKDILSASNNYLAKKTITTISKIKEPTVDDLRVAAMTNKAIRQTVQLDEPRPEKTALTSTVNIANLMASDEIEQVDINQLDAGTLAQRFKERGLPLDAEQELKRLGLV